MPTPPARLGLGLPSAFFRHWWLCSLAGQTLDIRCLFMTCRCRWCRTATRTPEDDNGSVHTQCAHNETRQQEEARQLVHVKERFYDGRHEDKKN